MTSVFCSATSALPRVMARRISRAHLDCQELTIKGSAMRLRPPAHVVELLDGELAPVRRIAGDATSDARCIEDERRAARRSSVLAHGPVRAIQPERTRRQTGAFRGRHVDWWTLSEHRGHDSVKRKRRTRGVGPQKLPRFSICCNVVSMRTPSYEWTAYASVRNRLRWAA